MRQAAQGNASGTTAQTPAIATTNRERPRRRRDQLPARGLVDADHAGLLQLDDFNASTVSGRAAYGIVSATGSYALSWTLSGASTSGAAVLALKAAPP